MILKFSRNFCFILILLINSTTSLDIKCDFNTEPADKNLQALYFCKLDGLQLTNENDTIIVDRSARNKSLEVQMLKIPGISTSNIPRVIFQYFPNLVSILVDGKELSTLQPYYFANASNLQSASFPNNKISEFDSEVFKEAPNLITLNLKNNEIEVIREDAFKGLRGLKFICLADNFIYRFHASNYKYIKNLKEIDFQNNVCNTGKFTIPNDKFRFKTDTFRNCDKNLMLEDHLESLRKVHEDTGATHNKTSDGIDKIGLILERILAEGRPANMIQSEEIVPSTLSASSKLIEEIHRELVIFQQGMDSQKNTITILAILFAFLAFLLVVVGFLMFFYKIKPFGRPKCGEKNELFEVRGYEEVDE